MNGNDDEISLQILHEGFKGEWSEMVILVAVNFLKVGTKEKLEVTATSLTNGHVEGTYSAHFNLVGGSAVLLVDLV